MSEQTPRGIRNNNPGNIRNSDKTDWQGEVDASQKNDKSFEEFEDMPHGYRALIKLLQNYRKKWGCITIADFIKRWAPPTENNTSSYINSVCKDLQVPSTYVPDIEDRETMCAMAAAISYVENGVPAVMDDVYKGWDLL
ncbi:MAG: structural protein P5 [Bacteroides sp.]|nr:structural protein P5 [Bacteroides sp.]